jgi:uncharacterized protein (DUF488 family)
MIKLFTIGFTGKSAERFFSLLKDAGVKRIIDIRLNNKSQLAGWAKGSDLPFFAKEIGNIGYEHNIDFAPTKDLLSRYRDKTTSWQEYEIEFLRLLNSRNVAQRTDIEQLHEACLLCSEYFPDHCHRRLLAEYFQAVNSDVEIIHLI